jgi:hypothetical protein
MNEWLTIQMGQLLLTCTISGLVVGTSVYEIEQNYKYPAYKANSVRATTFTGKGQFRCQTGC